MKLQPFQLPVVLYRAYSKDYHDTLVMCPPHNVFWYDVLESSMSRWFSLQISRSSRFSATIFANKFWSIWWCNWGPSYYNLISFLLRTSYVLCAVFLRSCALEVVCFHVAKVFLFGLDNGIPSQFFGAFCNSCLSRVESDVFPNSLASLDLLHRWYNYYI